MSQTQNTTTLNNNDAAVVQASSVSENTASITVPTNSKITVDASAVVVEKNEMFEPVQSELDDGTVFTSYKAVTLPPAIYKPNQSLESVYPADEVIVPQTRKEYVAQFRAAEERTARETLTMCRLVYEANKSLNSAEFADFCSDIGYKDSSSTVRKWLAIGKLQPRLIQHAEALPASWTGIYQITQIPAQVFENMMFAKRSFKDMSVSKITGLVKETRDLNNLDGVVTPGYITKAEKDHIILKGTIVAKVFFSKIPDDLDWHAFEKALREVEANLPVKIQLTAGLKELFTQRKNKRYEKIKVKQAPKVFKPESWDLGRTATQVSQTPLNDSNVQAAA